MQISLVLVCLLATVAPPATSPTAPPRPRPAAHASTAPLSADELFSKRALRRARLLIQMRMFEFRKERLECVREALLRQLAPELRDVGQAHNDTGRMDSANFKDRGCDFFSYRG